MTIRGIYSFAGGEEYITQKYFQLYKEIQEAIQSVDAAKCLVKESKEKTMQGKMLYSPVALNEEFKTFLFPATGSMLKKCANIQ